MSRGGAIIATGYIEIVKAILATSASATAAQDGNWCYIGKGMSASITIEGLESGGSVSIDVLNKQIKWDDSSADSDWPSNAYDGVPLMTSSLTPVVFTSNGSYFLGHYSFVKAKKTPSATSSNVTVTTATVSYQIPM